MEGNVVFENNFSSVSIKSSNWGTDADKVDATVAFRDTSPLLILSVYSKKKTLFKNVQKTHNQDLKQSNLIKWLRESTYVDFKINSNLLI